MKKIFSASVLLLSLNAFSMPRMGIDCRTTDAQAGIDVLMVVSRYSSDLYEDSVVYKGDRKVPEKDVAQFMNDAGDLFLKFYEAPVKAGPDRSGYKIRAKKGSETRWTGTLTPFQVASNPGPETEGKSRPLTCEADLH